MDLHVTNSINFVTINAALAKVKDCNEILGGYNPNAWKSDDSFSATKDSLIFSLKNNDRIE